MGHASIDAFIAALSGGERAICTVLRQEIDTALPDAESKIWHAHPVWFLDGNPIVGIGKLKTCVRLMFWSGQSFKTPGLVPEGSFKAAVRRYTDPEQIDTATVQNWLTEARAVQWDYKNIVKRKGRLERLV